MSRNLTKAALIAALLAAAWIGGEELTDQATIGFLIFGIANVVLAPQGTTGVRVVAILATVAALVSSGLVRGIVALLAWLAWPPAFLVAWSVSRDVPQGPRAKVDDESGAGARVAVAAIIAAVATGALSYRLILGHGLQQTAALFVGVPAILAIVVVFSVRPRSATGVACKAVTIGLLVSVLFLGEGMLCVVMSAPIFYAVAVLIGSCIEWTRREADGPVNRIFSCVALLALVPMSLEGVTAATSLNRDEWVIESRVVHASTEAVARAVFEPPRFDRTLPTYLRAGFPRPIATRIEHGSGKARWIVRLRGGEMRLDGLEPRTGDLVLELEEAQPNNVKWRAVRDDSHMTHFLSWREASVRWEPIDAHSTRVTWTLRYRRGLDPAWYFAPWERYAARLAAAYLIESVATP